jgi:hypothetical protein
MVLVIRRSVTEFTARPIRLDALRSGDFFDQSSFLYFIFGQIHRNSGNIAGMDSLNFVIFHFN